jgi:uncharacterized damage-inducible protein DinB
MYKDHFVELYDYTDWANQRMWDCVMKLSQADFEKHLEYSIGAIHIQCVHTMSGEFWWLGYLRTGEAVFITEEETELYKDRAKLRARWNELTEINKIYVATLTDTELQRKVKATWWDETDPAITVAQALTQVANHSTDHRSQIMAMLHGFGVDGVEQDFLAYLHRFVDEE